MADVTIYHNPRCTKSRQTLTLLQQQGIKPVVVEYLNDPPDVEKLKSIVEQLGISPRDLVRRKEFKDLGVDEPATDADWLKLMADNPRIIERPIVIAGPKAALGRPPENVLDILKQ